MGLKSLACQPALDDATKLCPKRKRGKDGILGDAAHMARKSDHNDGNAFDLTHDPDNGVDCNFFAKLALLDHRTKNVIWNRRIFIVREGRWKPFLGVPHDEHMHVSVKTELRDVAAPWPWASIES
ncbi:hypothetical protein [Massilia sp. CCM 8734]|uniref:hypothetical protein n=1 Tax=Massilia sp. CCM 8734 TaxID=2609283 RepID=UPI00141F3BEC|nr:hypothetical protein [Massilia sp. CCM 8734]NHZ99556.1 hypothetical protein [Massilia sp. CCM 8734]